MAIPGGFLKTWEPWLQGGIAASRLALGENWTAAFLHAPIWRFWLGADVAGTTSVGALMPSIDGVGRYFPLTLVAQGASGAELPPPEFEPFDGWFEGAEDLLLSALDEGADFDGITGSLARLSEPMPSRLPSSRDGVTQLKSGALVSEAGSGDFAAAIDRLRAHSAESVHGGMSYWWTAGGDEFAPRVASCRRMPPPDFFTGLLTGRFDDLAA
ncbi:type VI secretion system protein ImpM [Methylobacterium brachythecii]|nr:type VI secretion system protein ImpM [Methylobacterium brachythecii]